MNYNNLVIWNTNNPILKWTKDFNRHFCKWPISTRRDNLHHLSLGQCKSKCQWCQFTPNSTAAKKRQAVSISENLEKLMKPSDTADVNTRWCNYFRRHLTHQFYFRGIKLYVHIRFLYYINHNNIIHNKQKWRQPNFHQLLGG
jgi:hypothetical protein